MNVENRLCREFPVIENRWPESLPSLSCVSRIAKAADRRRSPSSGVSLAQIGLCGCIAPASCVSIAGERQRLSCVIPREWRAGSYLRALVPFAPGALDPESVVVRARKGRCIRGVDYEFDSVWGGIGCLSGGGINCDEEIDLSYRFSLRRIDAIVERKAAGFGVVQGCPQLRNPLIPDIGDEGRIIASVFIDYHSGADDGVVMMIERGGDYLSDGMSGLGRLPMIADKMRRGETVRIVCWGDSVTEGADVGAGESYPFLVRDGLAACGCAVEMMVVAVGGSNSRQWINWHEGGAKHPTRQAECDIMRVLDSRADLVVMEFLNDQDMGLEALKCHYRKIIKLILSKGKEVILVAPHRNWEPGIGVFDVDDRALVRGIREIVGEWRLGVWLADVASRWEGLWRQGIPFQTMLANGYNHPDRRGHVLYAKEIMLSIGCGR